MGALFKIGYAMGGNEWRQLPSELEIRRDLPLSEPSADVTPGFFAQRVVFNPVAAPSHVVPDQQRQGFIEKALQRRWVVVAGIALAIPVVSVGAAATANHILGRAGVKTSISNMPSNSAAPVAPRTIPPSRHDSSSPKTHAPPASLSPSPSTTVRVTPSSPPPAPTPSESGAPMLHITVIGDNSSVVTLPIQLSVPTSVVAGEPVTVSIDFGNELTGSLSCVVSDSPSAQQPDGPFSPVLASSGHGYCTVVFPAGRRSTLILAINNLSGRPVLRLHGAPEAMAVPY